MTDYNSVTDEDKAKYEALLEKEIVFINDKPTKIRRSLYSEYPKAIRHYISLFPNKFADAIELRLDKALLLSTLEQFKILLETTNVSEQTILNFIKDKKAYFLIGSILSNGYRFGHHALFVFPEFPFTVDYQADFLLVGKNSDGYHFVFIELENPSGNITIGDGTYGTTIRKGIIQIENWAFWLEKNFSHLKPVFEKDKKAGETLPDEFSEYDSTRVHYVVVAGRRADFTNETYRRNRENHINRKLQILHYDNIVEYAEQAIDRGNF